MVNLGVSKEDLKKRVPEDFSDAEANQEVVQVRYKFHQTRQMHTINSLLKERHRIKY